MPRIQNAKRNLQPCCTSNVTPPSRLRGNDVRGTVASDNGGRHACLCTPPLPSCAAPGLIRRPEDQRVLRWTIARRRTRHVVPGSRPGRQFGVGAGAQSPNTAGSRFRIPEKRAEHAMPQWRACHAVPGSRPGRQIGVAAGAQSPSAAGSGFRIPEKRAEPPWRIPVIPFARPRSRLPEYPFLRQRHRREW